MGVLHVFLATWDPTICETTGQPVGRVWRPYATDVLENSVGSRVFFSVREPYSAERLYFQDPLAYYQYRSDMGLQVDLDPLIVEEWRARRRATWSLLKDQSYNDEW